MADDDDDDDYNAADAQSRFATQLRLLKELGVIDNVEDYAAATRRLGENSYSSVEQYDTDQRLREHVEEAFLEFQRLFWEPYLSYLLDKGLISSKKEFQEKFDRALYLVGKKETINPKEKQELDELTTEFRDRLEEVKAFTQAEEQKENDFSTVFPFDASPPRSTPVATSTPNTSPPQTDQELSDIIPDLLASLQNISSPDSITQELFNLIPKSPPLQDKRTTPSPPDTPRYKYSPALRGKRMPNGDDLNHSNDASTIPDDSDNPDDDDGGDGQQQLEASAKRLEKILLNEQNLSEEEVQDIQATLESIESTLADINNRSSSPAQRRTESIRRRGSAQDVTSATTRENLGSGDHRTTTTTRTTTTVRKGRRPVTRRESNSISAPLSSSSSSSSSNTTPKKKKKKKTGGQKGGAIHALIENLRKKYKKLPRRLNFIR